jgi:phage-related minor tail protein
MYDLIHADKFISKVHPIRILNKMTTKQVDEKDLKPLADHNNLIKELRKETNAFGSSLSNVFAKGIVDGKRFEDVLKSIGKTLAESTLKAAFKPLELGLASVFEQGFKGLFDTLKPLGNAHGNLFQSGGVQPFAEGGVVASPTYFPMSRGLGLMGEAGAEAIMPLSRGADGKLGVKTQGGARPVSITVNIAAQDIESFRRSEAQVSASIARAIARGQRAM